MEGRQAPPGSVVACLSSMADWKCPFKEKIEHRDGGSELDVVRRPRGSGKCGGRARGRW